MKLALRLVVIIVFLSVIIAGIFIYPISVIHVYYRTWGLFIVAVVVASLIGGGYHYLSHPEFSEIDKLLSAISFALITALFVSYFSIFIILNVHGEGAMPISQKYWGQLCAEQ
jgi:hypothetical protein